MLGKVGLTVLLIGLAAWNVLAVYLYVVVPDHGKLPVTGLVFLSPAILFGSYVWLLWTPKSDASDR